jgi:hypothetical protein
MSFFPFVIETGKPAEEPTPTPVFVSVPVYRMRMVEPEIMTPAPIAINHNKKGNHIFDKGHLGHF